MPSPEVELVHGLLWSCLWSVAGTSKPRKSSGENEEERVTGLDEAHVLIHR